ncbi:sensor histidine kinase [Paenibacillus sp. DMB20]|uniref:sensor histidine kinase n=1 Tax=Paenibacillus sp. DMB20 TaxID=1642570 RepID=UPI0006278AE3|nr:HAMP domain-containing sensor histidine kinase [Paenibacillus sp. DMB20]KKO52636.1 histidine kinase [Paenibacillus sp. DMB20]
MKWRLTGRYLISIVIIVIIVIIMNITVLIGLYIQKSIGTGDPAEFEETSPQSITRAFQDQIVVSGTNIGISGSGKEILKRNKAWIQVLDEDGRQVYGFGVPKGVKSKYSPIDIVQMYKYQEVDASTMVFIGEKKGPDYRYSYFMGFANPYLERGVYNFDIRYALNALKIGSLILIFVDCLIALLVGYIFSKRLTKPLHVLIDGIKQLAHKNYHRHYESKGVYKDVFNHFNLLSRELKANEMERKKLDRMKEEWISNISHDIKTPLASIQGYAEMMKDKDYQFSAEEMRDYAEIIERKSLYLKDLIEDLNLSARLKNKELTLNKKSANIVGLVRNTVIDTLNDSRYSNRNIDFQCSDEMIKINVDEILIRRAISNLIYNAIVHNDEFVEIRVGVEKSGNAVCIRIEDNGKGIRQEEVERIFDRYYRGTNTGELHKGSGLGMAITRDIVRAHEGKIKVFSKLHQGTRIEIQFDLPEAGDVSG